MLEATKPPLFLLKASNSFLFLTFFKSMNEKYAQYLLKKTQQDYNLDSVNFAIARKDLPEDLKELANLAKEEEIVLDAGCGTGYLYNELQKTQYLGIDFSKELIEIAKKRYPQACFKQEDLLEVKLKDNYFDKIFSIGVLHQIPSKKLRLIFLRKLYQALKPEGMLIIRVWNLWDKKRKIIFKSFFKNINLDFKDIFLPHNNMYYHAFSQKELIKIVQQAGFSVKETYLKGKGVKANIYLIAEK